MKVSGIIAGALSMVMSAGLLAHTYTYKGKGHWRSADAEGKYKVRIEKTTSDKEIKLVTTIKSGDKTMGWEATLKLDSPHSATVYDKDGNSIGSAYCFHSMSSKTCHMDIKVDDIAIEETCHMDKLHMHRMGSKTDSTGKRTMTWEDDLILTDIDKN